MTVGTENIEKLAEVIKHLVIAGKKVSHDGKVDANDLPHVIALIPKLGDLASVVSHFGKIVEEGKDLDVSEVVSLIQLVVAKVKEVEKA